LVNVIVSSPDQRLAADASERAAHWLGRKVSGQGAVDLVGPAPSPIERLHGRWRWHFLLRSGSPASLGHAARALVEHFKMPPGDVRLALDRDPVALL